MNEHLTEQQLIDYQFKLASEAGMSEARAHLDQCETCRGRLAVLQSKFAALDLLREEVKPSETLISKTVELAATSRPARVIPLLRLPWLGTVAAAVIVGVALFLVSNHGPQEQSKTNEVSSLKPEVSSLKFEEQGHHFTLHTSHEPPPFAPASAIELVVLPRRENVQLTIYNAADLTLVRERRNLTLKQGWNWLQFMWANTLIDPTSLTLEPLEHKDQVQVQQLVYPPRLRELGRWLIHSDTTGQVPFELTYFTSGLAWRAFYTGTLSQDEKTMHLESYVRVNNASGEDYEDAQTRLIVGRIHQRDEIVALAKRRYPYDSPAQSPRSAGYGGGKDDKGIRWTTSEGATTHDVYFGEELHRKEIVKEGLSEYFLYTIEGTETIPDKWGKRLLSFQADDIPVKGLCKYDEDRWGTQTIRFLSFANDEDHKLGETPLPDGTVRIYGRVDEEGHLSYVGGTDVKYIPVGEEVELNLGPTRLVEVKPTLMEDRTENHVFDSHGNVTGWDQVQTWKIEVTNATTLPVDIEITRSFDTSYWTLKPADAAVSYEKHDATHARFKLNVEPRSKHQFEYVVTTYHGTREETLAGKEKRE